MWILVATLFLSGTAFMGWLYFLHMKGRKFHDDQYRIVAIVQNTPQAESLKTVYLAEMLGLSLDYPENLYQFDIHAATETMLANPLIKEAVIKKILPGTLYVQYSLRVPCALVADFTNTVIDEEGYLFPYEPFFTPKRLPAISIGLQENECHWGECVKDRLAVQLAFDLIAEFEKLKQNQFNLNHVDAVNADAGSYGRREIVMLLEKKEENGPPLVQQSDLQTDLRENVQADKRASRLNVYLRLSADGHKQNLANFFVLQSALLRERKRDEKNGLMIIDFRIPNLAFINPNSNSALNIKF